MSALLASTAAAFAVSVSTQAFSTQQRGTDAVTITEVSVDPGFVSGVIATAVGVSGMVGGERQFYLIPFMTVDQAKPRIGDRCEIVGSGTLVSSGCWATGDRSVRDAW